MLGSAWVSSRSRLRGPASETSPCCRSGWIGAGGWTSQHERTRSGMGSPSRRRRPCGTYWTGMHLNHGHFASYKSYARRVPRRPQATARRPCVAPLAGVGSAVAVLLPSGTMPMNATAAARWADTEHASFLDDLKALARIPSVSFSGFDAKHVEDSASAVAGLLRARGL